jgi:2-polyprenyl-6-hydroxyphenyl methylase/3-demethylubiquinone-9 3-methyltransferase
MWSLGDYREVAALLAAKAAELASLAGIGPGHVVLDVGAGSGNLAVVAAELGATVTACDPTRRMVDLGSGRTAAEGLDVRWVEGDAEALPFADGRFDVVASVFAAMFAPSPGTVAAELFRVARPGGLVAMANYGPGGFLAAVADLIGSFGPARPGAWSPFEWGDPAEAGRRLARLAAPGSLRMEPGTLVMEFASPEEGWAFWERNNPPLIALRQMLPADAYQALAAKCAELMRTMNQADGGRLALAADVLLLTARVPG